MGHVNSRGMWEWDLRRRRSDVTMGRVHLLAVGLGA